MDVTCYVKERIDLSWAALASAKDEDGKPFLRELADVMLSILAIPHSNAHCERVFSTVGKNRTEQRASLLDTTLESLLVLKSRAGHPSDDSRQLSSTTLQRLKTAYSRQNKD